MRKIFTLIAFKYITSKGIPRYTVEETANKVDVPIDSNLLDFLLEWHKLQ
jgi:hypothetical protein